MRKLDAPGLFGSIPARFPSDFDIEESIARLRAVVRPFRIGNLFEECAVGKVTESHVSLQRVIPLVGNSSKPFFKGRFVIEDGRVVLDGRLTMLLFVKIGTGVFIAFSLFFAVLGAVVWAQGAPHGPLMPFVGLGFALLIVIITWVGRWFARNDVQWLSSLIAATLSEVPHRSPILDPRATRNWNMTVFQCFLALTALGSAVSAATGIAMIQTGANGIEVTHHTLLSRLAASLATILLGAMVWGINQKSAIAWRIGLAAFPICGSFAIAQMMSSVLVVWGNQTLGAKLFALAFVGAGGVLVIAYWTFWWKKQRAYFNDLTSQAGSDDNG